YGDKYEEAKRNYTGCPMHSLIPGIVDSKDTQITLYSIIRAWFSLCSLSGCVLMHKPYDGDGLPSTFRIDRTSKPIFLKEDRNADIPVKNSLAGRLRARAVAGGFDGERGRAGQFSGTGPYQLARLGATCLAIGSCRRC
ncbi:MAG: hypothetical protein ACE5KS_08660, partial [Woeseiaceae bacterium]